MPQQHDPLTLKHRIGYDATIAVQSGGTIFGIKVLCLLFPAICAVGSWVVFRFVWNITPELKEKMAQRRGSGN